MTRQDLLTQYDVDENGIIVSLGKFESEPLYIPYFWDMYLNGFADDDDGESLTFEVTIEDREQFPELANVRHVFIWETDQGFVGHDCD